MHRDTPGLQGLFRQGTSQAAAFWRTWRVTPAARLRCVESRKLLQKQLVAIRLCRHRSRRSGARHRVEHPVCSCRGQTRLQCHVRLAGRAERAQEFSESWCRRGGMSAMEAWAERAGAHSTGRSWDADANLRLSSRTEQDTWLVTAVPLMSVRWTRRYLLRRAESTTVPND